MNKLYSKLEKFIRVEKNNNPYNTKVMFMENDITPILSLNNYDLLLLSKGKENKEEFKKVVKRVLRNKTIFQNV